MLIATRTGQLDVLELIVTQLEIGVNAVVGGSGRTALHRESPSDTSQMERYPGCVVRVCVSPLPSSDSVMNFHRDE